MNMKKLWIYFLLLFPLASCNDWLNIESEGSVTYQSYFKSEEDIVAVLNTMFIAERSSEAFSYPKIVEYAGLYCDELYMSGFKTLDPDRFFGRGVVNSGGNSWANYYNIIYLANVLEENRYRFEGITEEREDFWLAQANFMKAFAYFRVAQLWGDAPIPANSSDLDAIGKSPLKEVLGEALEAAEKATILPPKEQLTDAHGKTITSKQYASLGTVYTLLANIYAWMGGLYNEESYWQKAQEYATLVIGDGAGGQTAGNYRLEPGIPELISNVFGSKRNSDEIIFSITYSSLDYDFPSSSLPYSYIYPGYLLLGYPVVDSDPANVADDFGGSTKARITVESVNDLFSLAGDIRKEEYWKDLGTVEYNTGEVSPYAYLYKWREVILSNEESTDPMITAINTDKVVWRLADLKLLRAECYARLGQTDKAVADLNDIRERAGVETYNGMMEKEALRKEIFRERERELYGEGWHYFDAVRNGVHPRDNYYLGRISPTYAQLSDADIQNGALYLPVNKEAFTKNLNMTQNTYWLWRQ